MPLTMTATLRSRILTAGLDRLALALIGLGFLFLLLAALLVGLGPLDLLALFLRPILGSESNVFAASDAAMLIFLLAEVLFFVALVLAGLAAWRRATRAWSTPTIAAGDSVPLGPSWRERARRTAAMLGERRGRDVDADAATETAEPLMMLPMGDLPTDPTDPEPPVEDDPWKFST